ncbi:MAG: ribonuclease R [Lentisphaeria bacterium]
MEKKKIKQGNKSGRKPPKNRTVWQDDIRQRIIRYLSQPNYTPQCFPVLVSKLAENQEEEERIRKTLDKLLAEGTVVKLKKKGLALAESAGLLAGDIYVTRGGSGFVEVQEPKSTVFVPERHLGTALHRDRVLVRINKKADKRGDDKKLPEGEVIRILERRQRLIVGTLKKTRRLFYVEPMQAQITRDIMVPDPAGAKENDRVMVRLEEWSDPKLNPEGEIVEVIGPADNPALDTISVMKAHGIEDEFPEEVRQEAELVQLDEEACTEEDRKDLRDLLIFSIDPEEAKDFDDAVSLDRADDGNWRVGVHIADVSHFVRPDSKLDKEAFRRATSVYLPDKVVPMLPVQLSNGLCSLQEGKDRLAFSVFFIIDENANVKQTRFHQSVIRSRKRLNYQQALRIIEADAESAGDKAGVEVSKELIGKIKQCHQIAQKLREKRSNEGALLMELPEVKFKFDENGRIADVEPVKSDAAHQLIEELMLLANENVARFLHDKGVVQLHRVHPEPDEESLIELQKTFRMAGIKTGDLSDRTNFAELLERLKDMPTAQGWYVSVLRAMKRAEYSIEAIGHYGLAKQYYAHFTSPIRRYPDLVTHRLLKAVLQNQETGLSEKEMDKIANHCSQKELNAAEAEREITDLKLIRYFSEQLKSGDLKEFDAVVVEVGNKGAFVDLPGFGTSGLIHVSDMDDDFYDFSPERNELKGRSTGRRVKIGDRLKVVVSRIDAGRRWIDFAPVSNVN